MRKLSAKFMFTLSLLAFPSFGLLAQTTAGMLKSAQLFGREVGWAATDSQLFWTTSGGREWKEITPKTATAEQIASVDFLDSTRGLVLLSIWDATSGNPRFDLASTLNSGDDWSITHLKLPVDPEQYALSTAGRLDFLDSLHGYMNLDMVSSANFRQGILLVTEDGGKTWNWAPRSPGVAGSIHFVNGKDGWLAGGPGDEHLYATHDGSRTWQEVSLTPPAQVSPEATATYDVPVFSDDRHGLIGVTYSSDRASTLVSFATEDGGRTWKPQRVLADVGPGRLPTAMADSHLITATVSDRTLALTPLIPGTTTSSKRSEAVSPKSSILQLSFADSDRGWAVVADARLQTTRLLSTRDGGATWADITPANIAKATSDATSSVHISNGIGFHICAATTPANMQTWWTNSFLSDVGVYFGGVSRSCSNSNVVPSWLISVEGQGWGIMPLWAGPQAPCACDGTSSKCPPFPHVFPNNTTEAAQQGEAQALSAASSAKSLGLGGTVIYYDMENYASATCGAAVRAFVNAWDSELESLGFFPAVYGSPTDASKDWSVVSTIPDDVWLDSPNGLLTVWGLSPLCDPFSNPPCNLWSANQRIRQYGANVKASYGGVSLTIDEDIEDASVAGGESSQVFTYPSSSLPQFSWPGAIYTGPEGINDKGQVVGWFCVTVDECTGGPSQGFLYSNGALTQIPYSAVGVIATAINNPGQIVGWFCTSDSDCANGNATSFLYAGGKFTLISFPGSTDTEAYGINDDGLIVGLYADAAGNTHGFLYDAGKITSFDYPGSDDTEPFGINGDGGVVGTFYAGTPEEALGFIYYAAIGSFEQMPPANSQCSIDGDCQIMGTNNEGQILLWDEDVASLYDQNSGVITPLGLPVDNVEGPVAINDQGQITGMQICTGSDNACGYVVDPVASSGSSQSVVRRSRSRGPSFLRRRARRRTLRNGRSGRQNVEGLPILRMT